MQVPTIEMDQEEAAAKAMEYATAIATGKYPDTKDGRRQRDLDAASVKGFQALADGKRVINAQVAVSYAGQFMEGESKGLPRLAIARADATRVVYRYDYSTMSARFKADFGLSAYGRKNQVFEFRNLVWNHELAKVPFETKDSNGRRRYEHVAIVPTIPPMIRPPVYKLPKHFILWEANWQRAPADPFLLQHLAGDLFVVVAEWDLTELERGLLDHAMLRR